MLAYTSLFKAESNYLSSKSLNLSFDHLRINSYDKSFYLVHLVNLLIMNASTAYKIGYLP